MRKNTSTEKMQIMKGRKSVLSNRVLFLKATILLSIVIGMMGAPRALAADKLITFSNDTGRAANDLHVWFHQEGTSPGAAHSMIVSMDILRPQHLRQASQMKTRRVDCLFKTIDRVGRKSV